MELNKEKILERKKEILLLAAALALAKSARHSRRFDGKNLSFNISVMGDNAKTVIADRFDKSMKIISRLTGDIVLDQNNNVKEVIPDDENSADTSDELDAWERAVNDDEGWVGLEENTLQTEEEPL